MITTLKSRKKLLLHKHYFILAKHFFFFFLTISQLLQEEKFRYKTGKHKKPRNKFYFSPLFHYFPITQTEIEHKSNINLIK